MSPIALTPSDTIRRIANTIQDNPQLSTAAAQAFANCVRVTGTITISGNKP